MAWQLLLLFGSKFFFFLSSNFNYLGPIISDVFPLLSLVYFESRLCLYLSDHIFVSYLCGISIYQMLSFSLIKFEFCVVFCASLTISEINSLRTIWKVTFQSICSFSFWTTVLGRTARNGQLMIYFCFNWDLLNLSVCVFFAIDDRSVFYCEPEYIFSYGDIFFQFC